MLWSHIHPGLNPIYTIGDYLSACNTGDQSLIPGSGRSPGDGNGNPLQYSCLEKSHGQRSLGGYSPWGRRELDMSMHACVRTHTHTHTQLSVKLRTLLNHQCFVCKIIYCVRIAVWIGKNMLKWHLQRAWHIMLDIQ